MNLHSTDHAALPVDISHDPFDAARTEASAWQSSPGAVAAGCTFDTGNDTGLVGRTDDGCGYLTLTLGGWRGAFAVIAPGAGGAWKGRRVADRATTVCGTLKHVASALLSGHLASDHVEP